MNFIFLYQYLCLLLDKQFPKFHPDKLQILQMDYLFSILKTLIFFIIPSIMSLNSLSTWDRDRSEEWLKYWVVVAVFISLEIFTERYKGRLLEMCKLLFIVWCILPIEYNGSEVVYTFLLHPSFTAMDRIIFTLVKQAMPYLVRCVRVTKEMQGELPEIVELCSYRFKETLEIMMNTARQLLDLVLSKFIQKEVKPRLFSDIYRDFRNSLYE